MRTSILLAAVLALGACGKKEPAAPPAAPVSPAASVPNPIAPRSAPQASDSPAMPNLAEIQRLTEHFSTGKPLAAPTASGPWPAHPPPPPEPGVLRLYVSVNGSDVPEVPLGWPLVVVVSLHPKGAGPVRLSAPSGDWSSLVHLRAPESWPLRPPGPAGAQLVVDGIQPVDLVWTMTAEELDRIPRGTYSLEAGLDVPPGSGAWTGVEQGLPARVTLTAKRPMTEADDLRRTELMVRCLLARGGEARGEVDAFLRRRPEHARGIALLAEIQAHEGRIAEAVATLDRAIAAAVKRNPAPQLFPRDLARTRALLAARLGTDPSK